MVPERMMGGGGTCSRVPALLGIWSMGEGWSCVVHLFVVEDGGSKKAKCQCFGKSQSTGGLEFGYRRSLPMLRRGSNLFPLEFARPAGPPDQKGPCELDAASYYILAFCLHFCGRAWECQYYLSSQSAQERERERRRGIIRVARRMFCQ